MGQKKINVFPKGGSDEVLMNFEQMCTFSGKHCNRNVFLQILKHEPN
jgi:hypothetical protein